MCSRPADNQHRLTDRRLMKGCSGQAAHRLNGATKRVGDQRKMSAVDEDDRTGRSDGDFDLEVGFEDHPRAADLACSLDLQSRGQTDQHVRPRPGSPGDLLSHVSQVQVSNP